MKYLFSMWFKATQFFALVESVPRAPIPVPCSQDIFSTQGKVMYSLRVCSNVFNFQNVYLHSMQSNRFCFMQLEPSMQGE